MTDKTDQAENKLENLEDFYTYKPTTYFSVWNSNGTYLQSARVINAFTAKSAIEIFLNKYDTRKVQDKYNDEVFFVILLNSLNVALDIGNPEEEIRKIASRFTVSSKVIVYHDICEIEEKVG